MAAAFGHQSRALPLQGMLRRLATYHVHWPGANVFGFVALEPGAGEVAETDALACANWLTAWALA
jgi:hypothetical protein